MSNYESEEDLDKEVNVISSSEYEYYDEEDQDEYDDEDDLSEE